MTTLPTTLVEAEALAPARKPLKRDRSSSGWCGTLRQVKKTRKALEMADVVRLPTNFYEADMRQFADDQVALVRKYKLLGNDPFEDEGLHAMVRQALKGLAEEHERNAARLVELALAGAEDAIEALKDLIAERNAAGLPLSGALGTFATILLDRPPTARRPEGRPPASFTENFVIVCLITTLVRHYPRLRLRRSSDRHPSAFSIISEALIKAGVGHGGEEAIRQIWRRYGPPVTPGFDKVWPRS